MGYFPLRSILVYDYFNQTARICGKDERIEEEIGGDGFAWYEILGAESPGTSWD